MNFKAIVAQRLVPTVDGKRAAAIEILRHSPTVEALITRNEISGLKEVMEKSASYGMRTMDGALLDLYRDDRISAEVAIKFADSPNNVRLQIKLGKHQETKARKAAEVEDESIELSLVEDKRAKEKEEENEPVNETGAIGGINFTATVRPAVKKMTA